MKITLVAGTRPNFIKISPLIKAIENARSKGESIDYRLVHTGQHYDKNLSDTFFSELNIPEPSVNLDVKSGSHAEQTAHIMMAFEKDLIENPTDYVLVVGDVNSTMACAIVAKKLNTKVIHVEAGIRSGDLTMPEEINRIVTDSLSDYYFTTTPWASENLYKNGSKKNQVYFVGNVMIDTLNQNLSKLSPPNFWQNLELAPSTFVVLTLHRPSNVDDIDHLINLLSGISSMITNKKIIFPIHPRTKAIMSQKDIQFSNIYFVEPLGYLSFLYLVKHSFVVITDSGGLSEETTVLGIPCFTMRTTTERPETEILGTNTLVGTKFENLKKAYDDFIVQGSKSYQIPELWDGHAADRIIDIMLKW